MVGLSEATVLLVDDEAAVREAYAEMLRTTGAEVRTAESGAEALARLDGVDVVLLDRLMPGQSGDEVLAELRAAGHTCRVAMVTAVDPDEDIAEMPFDTYVNKPVTMSELVETVERLLALDDYESAVRERFRVARKLAALESTSTTEELEESTAYNDLKAQFERLTEEMDAASENVEIDELRGTIDPADE